ncbi:hypothetical protein OG21DRAFT_1520976 [Imleria badia]|nr:hypothetical protein OG21DRAFT_1520976 [Imleria badia]
MLQTGIDETGPSYQGKDTETMHPRSFLRITWYKSLPDTAAYYSSVIFKQGDVIKLTANASSTTKGYGQEEIKPQCGRLKIQRGATQLAPFANFDTVTIEDAVASGPSGIHTPEGAAIWNIKQDGDILAYASIDGPLFSLFTARTSRLAEGQSFCAISYRRLWIHCVHGAYCARGGTVIETPTSFSSSVIVDCLMSVTLAIWVDVMNADIMEISSSL